VSHLLVNGYFPKRVTLTGSGANNTRDTIKLCNKASEAGADAAIVIAPGYYSGALAKPALKQFFLDVQAASPIPVMIYNFPAASGGIDLDSQLISEVAREGSNICGVKLTCGAVGKLTRITAATATADFEQYPRKSASAPTFVTLGGFADFLAPTVAGGRAHGAIMGLGNIYPRSLVHLLELSLRAKETQSFADLQKAVELQDLVAGADDSFAKAGIAGTKWWLHKHDGYPNGRVRRPLLDFAADKGAALEKDEAVLKLMAVEKSLAK
jgi:dihydrodipicolinate synthase/N-acetylneuraminate lyase